MSFPVAPAGAPLGLQPDQERVRVINNTGSATVVGELVQFDLDQAGDADNYRVGDALSVFASVKTPVDVRYGWFAVCLEAVADRAEMTVVVRGKVPAGVSGLNLVALTDILTAEAGLVNLDSDVPVAGEKILAVPLEATVDGTLEVIDVLFNGIEGYGYATG